MGVDKRHSSIKKKRSASMSESSAKRRSRTPISNEDYRALLDLGNKQPTINMTGGVGIPGPRKLNDVTAYAALDFAKIPQQTGAILDMSAAVRGHGDIESVREQVKTVNRKVEFAPDQMGMHSLHVGNDIAAVWNSRVKDKSKVYDYPDLAKSLDRRLEHPGSGKKTYWASEAPLEERRAHVATGMQHLISGDRDAAALSFGQAGLTPRGQKWAHKMSNLMLAEVGRDHHGGGDGSRVQQALGHVIGSEEHAGKSFSKVFVDKADKYAPFAKRNGAKTFKG
ncbi:hypothetical protein [Oleiagrimonas soli]|uniref:Uncharacterized protein n=1 Tax=Oleiagrimonas soli TaxID=1543381 RepID=A0A099CWS9_9GAMM|nr:hypothetical protein [Oleiagrimonas soli]KGI78204.1 hypothetical protein LF63_0107665 [Oleiagrimonas soli]MBB6183337.1 hypothetical protein [Oleiagrimonas soli]